MFGVLIKAKLPGLDSWEGLGKHTFRALPRVGEYISKEIDGVGMSFQVVAVIHPDSLESEDYVGDLYVVQVGTELDAVKSVFAQAPPAREAK